MLQAQRLGAHIANRSVGKTGPIQRIFASNLQRAYRTAEAITDACRQPRKEGSSNSTASTLDVTRVEELREKDFGLSEGKRFGSKESDDNAESAESMRLRIDHFLEHHLSPIIDQHVAENVAVVVVAHGIILNVLLKALIARYPPTSTAAPFIGERPGSEYLAAWSNTGVLQAHLDIDSDTEMINMTVEHTNNVDHLQGLKKTRGGIGSAKFDSRQRTMDSFFVPASKKRKLDDRRE